MRELVLPKLERHRPIEAWIIDDTSFPKKGQHSVGVARQYCGELGKQDNCQVAVTLSISNHDASLPVAYRLYLPKEWAGDRTRRRKVGRGFHHHATLCIAAYGFLLSERETIPPQEIMPPRSSRNLPYAKVTSPEDPPLRPERHVPNSIATMRR